VRGVAPTGSEIAVMLPVKAIAPIKIGISLIFIRAFPFIPLFDVTIIEI